MEELLGIPDVPALAGHRRQLSAPRGHGRTSRPRKLRRRPEPAPHLARYHAPASRPAKLAKALAVSTILQRIASGDQASVDECVREYGGLVYRLAKRHLDKVPAEIDDAVQEVFIELWTSASRFDPEKGGEPAFVATLAHRRLIDRQRQATARSRHQTRAARLGPPPRLSETARADSRDEAGKLSEAFDALPEIEREVLWMSVCGGLSHREIGMVTDCPIGTVKSRLRRAMARLTEALMPAGEGTS